MTKIQVTPEQYQVFNEFDRMGVLLGLSRLENESNVSYKQRLMDVFVNRSNSTYRGLINGITRELGLSISEVIEVVPVVDGNGAPLVEMPAIVFKDTKCYLYNDYSEDDVLLEIDRFEEDGDAWSINDLITTINNTGIYTATLLDTNRGNDRSMTIFNQSSIVTIASEDISLAGGRHHLDNRNLIAGTAAVTSGNLRRRLSSLSALSSRGDYYIDLSNGILYMVGQASPGSIIRYQYRDDEFVASASPVILHKLQSDDFRTKMFQQITTEDGTVVNGAPTPLGADIINELLSVHPSSYGV